MLRARSFSSSFGAPTPLMSHRFPSFSSYYAAVSNLIPRLFSPIPSPLPSPRSSSRLPPPAYNRHWNTSSPPRRVPFRSVRGRFARALLSLLSSLLSLHSNYPPLSHSRVAYNSLPRYPSRPLPLFPASPFPPFPPPPLRFCPVTLLRAAAPQFSPLLLRFY